VATDRRGSTLAIGHADGSIALFSLGTGRPLPAPTGHAGRVESITFSADGHLLATTGDDDYVNLSNLGTGRPLGRLAGHTAAVTGAVFSADNSTLYTSSLDENVIGWDITHLNNLGQRLLSPGYGPNEAPVTFIAVSLTGEIAAEYADGTVRFWARGSNSPSPPIQVTDGRPVGGAFSPDGRLFATAEVLGPVPSVGVDPRTTGEVPSDRRPIQTSDRDARHPPAGVWAVTFSPSGKEILLIDDEDSRRITRKGLRDRYRISNSNRQAVPGHHQPPPGGLEPGLTQDRRRRARHRGHRHAQPERALATRQGASKPSLVTRRLNDSHG
jgi:WD40 repeat protein